MSDNKMVAKVPEQKPSTTMNALDVLSNQISDLDRELDCLETLLDLILIRDQSLDECQAIPKMKSVEEQGTKLLEQISCLSDDAGYTRKRLSRLITRIKI